MVVQVIEEHERARNVVRIPVLDGRQHPFAGGHIVMISICVPSPPHKTILEQKPFTEQLMPVMA
jgi:hypothetical protein